MLPDLGKTGGARVGDFDGDSKEELLVYGDDNLHLLDGPDLAQAEVIFTRDPSAHPCLIRTAIADPSEHDKIILFFGELDDLSSSSIIDICRPLVLRRDDGGEYSTIGPWEQADFEPNVLAVGRSDVDGDGLLDTALAVDTFSSEVNKNTGAHPGGIVRGVLSFEPEPLDFVPWVINSNRAWGSFMGINELLVGSAAATFVSDLGIPLVRTNATGDDLASLLPATATGDPQPYSWSPIVADFNLDQRDDVVLTRGTVVEIVGPASQESDIFLVQAESGFDDRTSSSGLLEHPYAFPDRTDRLHYSKSRRRHRLRPRRKTRDDHHAA